MLPEALQQDPVAAALAARFGDAITGGNLNLGELTLEIDPARIVEGGRCFKDEQKFEQLSSVTCVDWHPREPRFEIVYHLRSYERKLVIRLKCKVGAASDAYAIDSVYPVWRSADWYEREVFDLFGVTFHNHPDLRRIMLPDHWKGHPLRKDYPVHGYKYSYADQQ